MKKKKDPTEAKPKVKRVRKPAAKKSKERYSGIKSSEFISTTDSETGKIVYSTKSQLNFNFLVDMFENKNYETMFSIFDPFLYVHNNLQDLIEIKEKEFYLKSETKSYLIPNFESVIISLCSDINSYENLEYFKKFLVKLLQNVSKHEMSHFLKYLSSQNFMINEDGNLFAYKAVKNNYKDKHSGTIDNYPGNVVTMERSKVNQDSNQECSYGLHVGNLTYIKDYWSPNSGDILLAVEIDPRNLVSVPGYDQGKIRVCEYKVLCTISYEQSLKNHKFISTEEFVETYKIVAAKRKEFVEEFEVKKLKTSKPKKTKKKETVKVNLAINNLITEWVKNKINKAKTKALTFGTLAKSFKKDFPENSSTELKFAVETGFKVEKNPKFAKSIITLLNQE